MNVFTSKTPLNNYIYTDLYDLLEPEAAVPVIQTVLKPEITHSLKIKTEKTYVSKKTSKEKVKTVGGIRKEYEQQIWEDVNRDLEKQHNYLSECVGRCSFKEEHVLDRIKHTLTSTSPILRSTWPILTNANVRNHSYPRQYVRWNGKTVLLHGSAGGSKEYLYNFDIANEIDQLKLMKNMDFQKNLPLKSILDKSNNRGLSENEICKGSHKSSDPISNEKHKGNVEVKGMTAKCKKSLTGRLKKCLHKHSLSINLARLNFPNVEPLCMEHELYRCFCKCKLSTNQFSESMCPVTPNEPVDDESNSIQTRSVSTRENIEYLLEKENNDKTDGPVENNSAEIMDAVNELTPNIFTTSDTENEETKCKYEQILQCLLNNSDNEINILIDESNKQSTINNVTVLSDDTTNSSHAVSKGSLSKFQRQTQTIVIDTKTNLDTTKQRFSSWINYEYHNLKTTLAKGEKITLRKPCPNKVMLIPYSELVERYKQGKNVFLVNREHPNQVYIVIDPKNEDFKHLVNADRINTEELYRYSDFLKHLLLNTPLIDNFVLLKGFHNSWEIVGLVSKRRDTTEVTLPSIHNANVITDNGNICNFENMNTIKEKQTTNTDNSLEIMRDKLTSSSLNAQPNKPSFQSDAIASINNDINDFGNQGCKWYYMAVGNDFIEIRFPNKKFFVKHTTIISTIYSAHSSNKTLYILLSKETRTLPSNDLKFGIYINPHLPKNHILIGPYEQHEDMSINLVRESYAKHKNNETIKDSVVIFLNTGKICNSVMINNSLPIFVEIQNVISRGVKRKVYNNDRDNVQFVEKRIKSTNSDYVVVQSEAEFGKYTMKILEPGPCYRPLSQQITCKGNHTEGVNIIKPINRQRITHQDPNYNKQINTSHFYMIPRYPIITAVSTLVENYTNNSSEKYQSNVGITKKSAEPESEKDYLTPIYSDELEISAEVEIATDSTTRACVRVHTDAIEIPAHFSIENDSITSGEGNEISKIHSTYANSDKMKTSSYIEMMKANMDVPYDIYRPYETVKIFCKNVENFGYLNGRRVWKNYPIYSFQYPYSDKFSYYYNENYAFRIINAYLNEHMDIEEPLKLEWKVVNTEDESETGNLFRITAEVLFSHKITNKGKLVKK